MQRSFVVKWLLLVLLSIPIFMLLVVGKVWAISAAGFDAGYIMSDYQMNNYNSMSEGEIQHFLTLKNGCGNRDYGYYVKLSANKNYHWHFDNGHFICLSEEKFGEKDGEIGFQYGETAAHIIWQAAQDYRINPQVLIATLQRESSLITDAIPNNVDYRKAMGYGCPDGINCASRYYGFKNQVRNAASLFRTVMDGGWTNYPVGKNYIAYNPNTACGGSVIDVRNRATSALYRYTPYQPNEAALAAGYGTAPCGAYGNRNFYLLFEEWFGNIKDEGKPSLTEVLTHNREKSAGSDLDVDYRTHVEEYGWLPWSNNGGMAGTAGYSLRVEALELKLKQEVGIEYRTYIQNTGWSKYVKDGAVSGTTGKSLRIEAMQIRLYGEIAKRYDVYYRVHVQDSGWMDWVKNDEVAGVIGKGLRIEALQVRLVKKDLGFGPSVNVHVQDIGWMNYVKGGNKIIGTTGRSLRVEAFKVKKGDSGGLPSGEISYRAHVEDIGWMKWVKSGAMAGTTGKGLRVEALQIKLNGELAKKYDVYYRVHVQDIGWMKWVKNGGTAGTTGQAKRVEAMQVELVKKK